MNRRVPWVCGHIAPKAVEKEKLTRSNPVSPKKSQKNYVVKRSSERGVSVWTSDAVGLQAKVDQFPTATPQTVLEQI